MLVVAKHVDLGTAGALSLVFVRGGHTFLNRTVVGGSGNYRYNLKTYDAVHLLLLTDSAGYLVFLLNGDELQLRSQTARFSGCSGVNGSQVVVGTETPSGRIKVSAQMTLAYVASLTARNANRLVSMSHLVPGNECLEAFFLSSGLSTARCHVVTSPIHGPAE